jgi:uncharacterized protein (DUF302 family)
MGTDKRRIGMTRTLKAGFDEALAQLPEALKSEGLGVLVVYEDDAGRAVVKAVDPMRTMAAGDPALNEVAQEVHERLARVLERLE